jgi:hypothetical protein
VGIGDLFILAGQSNSTPVATNAQNYSHATLKAGMYADSQGATNVAVPTWHNLAVKSWWPKIATDLMAQISLPVGFVPCGWGSTSIANWQKVGGLNVTGTPYNLYQWLVLRIQANATLAVPPRCVLWFQGESDVTAATPRATYLAALTQLANDLYADTGCKLMPCKIGNYGNATNLAAVNNAIGDAWTAAGNVLTGPDFSDLTPSSGPHFVSDAEMLTLGGRWATAIITAFGW